MQHFNVPGMARALFQSTSWDLMHQFTSSSPNSLRTLALTFAEPIGDRLLVFGPLPLDTTEDELHAFFTDAHRVVVAVDSKGQAKG